MRFASILALLVLLVAPRAVAGEPALVLDPEDLDLVPLEHTRFGLLAHAHRATLEALEHRHDVLEELRAERDERDGESEAWRKAEREVARKALVEASAQVVALLRANGVEDAVLAEIAAFPRGPMRVERYALSRLRALPMGEREGALVREVAASTLGALMALDVRVRALESAEDEAEEREEADARDAAAALARERRLEALEEQADRTRRRFWQLIDFVLDEAQKRALKKRLPHEMQETEDLFGHAMHLPGLTIGQMARVRALEAELVSEATPDHVLAERLEQKLDQAGLTDEEREPIWRELDALWHRVMAREHDMKAALSRVLTEPQRGFLAAVPPRVSLGQRLAEPQVLLRGVALTDAQTAGLVPLARTLIALRETLEQQMETLRAQMEEMGPDSPQMEGMAMREASVAGALVRKTREAMRTIFLDVMTPDQVVQWVILPPVEDD